MTGLIVDNNLFSCCWLCLNTGAQEDKLDCVQRLVERWHLGRLTIDHETPVNVLAQAGLPEAVELVHPSRVPRRRLGSKAGRIALLHAVAHIEFSAINLALDAVYRFRHMPETYYADWLRVAAEECYHFKLVDTLLNGAGVSYGSLPAHNGLWQVALYSSDDVMLRMALVPRVLEARGLDVTPDMIRRLSEVGDDRFADILGIIFRDEIRHVRTGSQWFKYVCRERNLDSEVTFNRILNRYTKDTNAKINGPFRKDARMRAGFSEKELQQLTHEAH